VRYADDSNIYVSSERAGHRVMATIVRFIERRLRLKVNAGKSAVARPETRHFVGFRLQRSLETAEIEVLPSKRSLDRMKAKIRELTPRNWGQSMSGCISRINAYSRGWIGFFGICSDTPAVVRALQGFDAHLRRRLRAIQLRQWKRKRIIARHLIRMKKSRPETVWRHVYEGRKSLWALSHSGPVDRTMNKYHFSQLGYLSLEALYRGQPRFVIAQEQLALDLDSCGWKRRRRSKGLSSPTPRVPTSRM
jgi:RNA-directed DNA polymerase